MHLPLLVPEPDQCGIRVAGESRRWAPGECLIFDDSFEHEVWNDGAQVRIFACAWHVRMGMGMGIAHGHGGAALGPVTARPLIPIKLRPV